MTSFSDKKAILFDLDGTIIDSAEGIFNALYYMFNRVGVKVDDNNELYKFMGPSIGSMLKTGYGFNDKDADDAVDIYREYYSTQGLLECKPYEGILELLKTLKYQGKKVALATKKPEVYAKKIIDNLGFNKYFDAVCGASLDDSHNSKEHIINTAVDLCGVTKEQAVMIGDTKYDAIGAKNADVDCIGVLYGVGDEDSLLNNGAKKTVTDVNELSKYLTKE